MCSIVSKLCLRRPVYYPVRFSPVVPSFSYLFMRSHSSCLFDIGQPPLVDFGSLVRDAEEREWVFLYFNIGAFVRGR